MWTRWVPWRFILRQAAKKHNILDPFEIFAQISRFAQPADTLAPSELLRAGFIFHARGLINSQAIQHNLDWVWPFWVQCQFDPENKSFIPRAFSLTHVNLTHRNWTALGLPDSTELPIVDPRGLLTPFWDGWSIDCWLVDKNGKAYVPSRAGDEQISQELKMDGNIAVVTRLRDKETVLSTHIQVAADHSGGHVCQLKVKGMTPNEGWLVVSLRPYNPEGISFIHRVEYLKERNQWLVDKKQQIHFQDIPEHRVFSYYRSGDVFARVCKRDFESPADHVDCYVGMATAAALFPVQADEEKEICIDIPLVEEKKPRKQSVSSPGQDDSWEHALAGLSRLQVPDKKIQFLYDAAVRTVILHSVEDIYPGPYTYKRFWFRDAVLILNAMLSVGMIDRSERMLKKFPKRQTVTGYFRSQEGEWDSNGQVLWIIQRFHEMSGRPLDGKWRSVIERGAHWIKEKRTAKSKDLLHAGLLPAGFSAEHFGPNDYYYWDNFWSVGGLNSAARYFRQLGDDKHALYMEEEARDLSASLEQSFARVREQTGNPAIPTSPYRRMDSGAIGSLAGNYPLQILEPRDPRVMATAEYLLNHCLIENGFFHDMSHSGINPYLTLHLAQVLLRAGDPRYWDLMNAVAGLASPTGQWPEAIHPITKGGCMGDGQHVWAAAEWIMMVRNCFVREDGGRLILCSGVAPKWFDKNETVAFGPAPTTFGPVSIRVLSAHGKVRVEWNGQWRKEKPRLEIRIPGLEPQTPRPGQTCVEFGAIK